MKTDFDFIHLEFALSDGTERIIHLQDNEYQLEDKLGKLDDENPYPMNDMDYFISYLALRLYHGYNLDEYGIYEMARDMPTYMLGMWLTDPLPNHYLDDAILEGVYIINITDCTTSKRYAVKDRYDPIYYGTDTQCWMFIAGLIANGRGEFPTI